MKSVFSKPLLFFLLALFLGSVSFFLGQKMGLKSRPSASPAQTAGVAVYYLKKDGLYRVTSDSDKEENLFTASNSAQLKRFGNQLIFVDQSGLESFSFNGKKTTLDAVSDGVTFKDLTPSSDGQRLAYVKLISLPGGGYKNELWLWENTTKTSRKLLQEPDLGQDPEGVFYVLALNGWMDQSHLLVGRAYEGVSFCLLDIDNPVLPPTCQDWGSEGIGKIERILTATGDKIYGVAWTDPQVFPEASASAEGLFVTNLNREKTWLSEEFPSNLVANNDKLYVFKNLNSQTLGAQNSDLFSLDFNGENEARLTHNASTVLTKENLTVSDKGRFLSWTSYDRSRPGQQAAWVYDLNLNQGYQVSDQGSWPVVVEY